MERPPFESRDWDRGHTATAVVVSIAVLALLARFVLLGDRVAHWDEARVGFWILDYMETGNYSYSPVIHGPFYHHVNPLLFEWFGKTDATMRIVPALVTGLLPLTALLFRSRLDRIETVALAAFLAFDPIVLYYSRFMRGDPLVGAFMFAGFAFLVRAIDTDRTGHLLAASALIALGFTTKENAFVYVLCWLGGLAVAFDHRFVTVHEGAQQRRTAVRDALTRGWNWLGRHGIGVIAAVVEFFVVIIVFYAPRSNGRLHVPGPNGGSYVGWNALTDPSLLGRFVWEATAGSFESFFSFWGNGSRSEHAYLPYLVDLLETIGYGSFVLVGLACIGFFIDRYATEQPRALLTIAFAWGVASVFGYPIITDIKAPWAAVHVVLPLMIPAAIGVGALIRSVRAAATPGPWWMRAGSIGLVLLVISAPVAAVGAHSVYQAPQSPDNDLVQYAQPTDDIHPTVHEIERIAADNEGTDVVLYGQQFVNGDPIYQQPSCSGESGWFDSLPLPWYLVRSDASVACAQSPAELDQLDEEPPVVIASATHVQRNESGETVTEPVVPEELDSRFEGYDATIKRMRTTDTDVVFLIDRDRANSTDTVGQG